MRTMFRKIYMLPGIWQLFTIPVLTPGFALTGLEKSAADRRQFPWAYWLLNLVCLVELGALVSWYAMRISGRFTELQFYAQGCFALSALTLLTVSGVYAYCHRTAFWEHVAKSGFSRSQPEETVMASHE